MFKSSLSSIAFATLPLLAVAGTAKAGFAEIGPPNGSELSQAEILNQLYGGTFVSDGLGFTNGSLSLSRVDDDVNTALSPEVFGTLTGPVTQAGIHSVQNITADGPVLHSINGKFDDLKVNPSDNDGGIDHLVLYHSPVGGLSESGDLYVLFWDDTFGDRDFNDYVVGTQQVEGAVVPLPPAALGALMAFAPLALKQMRRRRR